MLPYYDSRNEGVPLVSTPNSITLRLESSPVQEGNPGCTYGASPLIAGLSSFCLEDITQPTLQFSPQMPSTTRDFASGSPPTPPSAFIILLLTITLFTTQVSLLVGRLIPLHGLGSVTPNVLAGLALVLTIWALISWVLERRRTSRRSSPRNIPR